MTSAGFSTSNFTMEGSTIKYTGDMTVATDLDISACNLVDVTVLEACVFPLFIPEPVNKFAWYIEH